MGACGQLAGGRGEGLVLAEDPGGQERQQHAQLHAGDLAADGAEDRVARAAAAALLHLLQQRLEDLPEAGDVRPDPAGAVDDEDGGVVGLLGGQAGEAADVLLRGLGVAAEFRDDGPGLVAAHLGARPYEPGRGGHREIPVDHAGRCADARHSSTVRERCRWGQAVAGGGVEGRVAAGGGARRGGVRGPAVASGGDGGAARRWPAATAPRTPRSSPVCPGPSGPPTRSSCPRPGRRSPGGARRGWPPCRRGC